jgi:hypothetical protein
MLSHLLSFALILLVAFQPGAPKSQPQDKKPAAVTGSLVGRWQVKFLIEAGEKHLILDAKPHGSATLTLLDTGVDSQPVPGHKQAIWSELTNSRVSFSSELELPLGTCCREIGTVMFKGRFLSNNSISGKLVFVTSVDEEENPNKLRSVVGTFTATRLTR